MLNVPRELPAVCLEQVLLPSAFATISFPGARFGALLEHLGSGAGDVYVAIIPDVLSGGLAEAQNEPLYSSVTSLAPAHAGVVATAARVLQIARVMQSGNSVLLLEGLCRVRVDSASPSSDSDVDFDTVTVTPLEPAYPSTVPQGSGVHGAAPAALPPPSSAIAATAGGRGQPAAGESQPNGGKRAGEEALAAGGSASDPTLPELGRQLKATARALLRVLARKSTAPTHRLAELLTSLPPAHAADMVAAALATTFQERLAVLQAVEPKQRVKLALALATHALESLRASAGGNPRATTPGPPKATKPKAGQAAGEGSEAVLFGAGSDDESDGLDVIMARLAAARPPPEVARAAAKEYKRLKASGEQQPGASAVRTYLETLADLPWSRSSADAAAERAGGAAAGASGSGNVAAADGSSDKSTAQGGRAAAGGEEGVQRYLAAPMSLRGARKLLDEQHHGLDKIKDRVIEYLAVLRLKGPGARAPILCFIGPPGVGKTSLARSVAEVLGRPFVRIALGGVRDEAEVRGHRRTYVGAMPGRLVAGLRRARVNDPVMLLDELDKMGRDSLRGDPAAALLEVLDPEQNHAFTDAYLALPVDLSHVTFVATANRMADIPAPLLDRLEVITLSGYTVEEKVHIARHHLLPKALADHGLSPGNVHVEPAVLEHIVNRYTREAGVRSLARQLAALCRHVAVSIVSGHEALLGNGAGHSAAGLGLGAGSMGHVHPAVQAPRGAEATSSDSDAPSLARAQEAGQLVDSVPSSAALLGGPASLAGLSEAPLDRLFAMPGARHGAVQQGGKEEGSEFAHASLPAAGLVAATHVRRANVGAAPPSLTARVGRMFSWASPAASKGHGRDVAASQEGHVQASLDSHHGRVPYHGMPQPLPYPADLLQQQEAIIVTTELVEAVLGPPRFDAPAEACEAVALPGAAAGLVWTAVGGSMQIIECARISYGSPDRAGTLTLTGQVGEVLEESARIALSWIRAHAPELPLSQGSQPVLHRPQRVEGSDHPAVELHAAQHGGDPQCLGRSPCNALLQTQETAASASVDSDGLSAALAGPAAAGDLSPAMHWDVHVHLPAGSIPKDGPSAGVTLVTALLSLFCGRAARADTAMTGELTLRGLVLPVGGIKEKLLAAAQAGMTRVIVPARNMRDVVADVPPAVRATLTIIPAERIEQVLAAAFDPPLVPSPPPPIASKL